VVSYWIGVHIMMLLGFGGLMQFLAKYGKFDIIIIIIIIIMIVVMVDAIHHLYFQSFL